MMASHWSSRSCSACGLRLAVERERPERCVFRADVLAHRAVATAARRQQDRSATPHHGRQVGAPLDVDCGRLSRRRAQAG